MHFKSKIPFLVVFLMVFSAGLALADERLSVGTVIIKPELTLDMYTHKLGNNWSYTRTGYKGMNYNYSYNPSSSTSNEWGTVTGQTLLLDMEVKPHKDIYADLGFRFINQYADKFWVPINLEHKMKADGKSYYWDYADVKFNPAKRVQLGYMRGAGHGSWQYDGDLFNLYPEQWETERYLRISGHPVPELYQANYRMPKWGNLQLMYGTEAVWDYKQGVYLNYAYKIGKYNLHLFHRDDQIPYGKVEERMRSTEVSTDFNFLGNEIGAGILYRPFRLDYEYTYVSDAAPGTGIGGSTYNKHTGTTGTSDAFGFSTKVNVKKNKYLDAASVQYTYQGLVAGNKQEVKTHLNRKITREIVVGFDYTYRKPLLGPVPLVYQNVNGNLGPVLLEPRGPDSPFWVGWGDPGTGNNREASIISAIFTFDPTPGTWFYVNEPDNLDDYNLNPSENSFYSFAAVYTLTNYPTSTDRLIYKDSENNILWDDPSFGGAWPTNGYIGEFLVANRFTFKNKLKATFKFGFGDSLATNSSAYTASTLASKPITNYFISTLILNKEPYSAKIVYNQDYWGPELWQRQFGETFDRLYQLEVSRTFGEYLSAGIGYTGARETDEKYISSELGDYDEIRCTVVLKFGPVKGDFKQGSQSGQVFGIRPNMDATPPRVAIDLEGTSFTPNNDGVEDYAGIKPFAMDVSEIYEWTITIKNSNGITVKTFSGQGQPPALIRWDGKDENNLNVRQDNYQITLEAIDGMGNAGVTEPSEIYLITDSQKK